MADATQNLKLKITSDTSQMRTASGGFSAVTAAIAAMTGALYTAKKAYENVILPVMDYNRELLRMSESTGMGLEAAARITEVAEGAGISFSELATALERATKNGFNPTLESIAGLADEIEGMNDPSERAEYLSKLLGANWAVLLPLLQDGGPAFLALAAAVDAGLVPTQEFVNETEELRDRVDRLTESMEMTKLKLLVDLIPAFMDGADWAAKFLEQLNLVNNSAYGQQYGSRGGVPLGPAPRNPTRKGGPSEMAFGGEIGTGGSYIVGEHGAERFTPATAGSISPNNDTLAQAINRMVRTLPTVITDAIERSK